MGRLYKVNQVARLYDITTHTLRYYDKKGLFTPEIRDEESGYRYYTINQFRKLEIILHLRNLNFSIESIIEHLEKLDYNFTHQIIEKKIEENRKEIDNLMQIEKKLHEEKKYFRELMSAESEINRPFIEELAEKKGFYVEIEDKQKESLFEGFKQLDMILSPGWKNENIYGILVDKEDIPYYGFKNPKLIVFNDREGKSSYTQKKGTYASMYTFKSPNKTDAKEEKNYDFFFNWIKEEGYEVDGDFLIELLVGPGRAKDKESFLDKLMVPVKKMK